MAGISVNVSCFSDVLNIQLKNSQLKTLESKLLQGFWKTWYCQPKWDWFSRILKSVLTNLRIVTLFPRPWKFPFAGSCHLQWCLNYLLVYFFICSLVYLSIYLLIDLFISLFIYLFIYLFAYNSAERPVDWKSKFFKIKLYYFEGSLSLWYNIILKLLSVSYILKINSVYWNNKIKCIDEMHYACIISMVGSSHWEVFLENRSS